MVRDIEAAINHWQLHTCIRFEKFNKTRHEKRRLVIHPSNEGSCSTSWSGYRPIPSYINLGIHCDVSFGVLIIDMSLKYENQIY